METRGIAGKHLFSHASRQFDALSDAFGFSTPRRLAGEILILSALCATAAAWAVFLFSHFDFDRVCRGFDFWFDSDPARTVSNITTRWSYYHIRSNLHPLYGLFVSTPFGILSELFGVRPSMLTTIYVAVQSALYAGVAYVAMRAFGLQRLESLLGIALLYSTSAGLYWIGFPEWTAFGAVAVMGSVIWISGPAAIRNRVTGAVQSMVSGSMVVTSWAVGFMASLISNWPKLDWRQAFVHTRDALALMAALTVLQYLIYPHSSGFLNIWGEIFHTVDRRAVVAATSLLAPVADFFAHTLVAPEPAVVDGPRTVPGWGVLLMVSEGQPVSATPLAVLVLLLWAALLALGVHAGYTEIQRPAFLLVIGTLAYFFLLHTAFGGEIFLFSLHFAPFLVFIAVWSLRSHYKLIARGLVAALVVLSFANNYPAFRDAAAFHNAIDESWIHRDADAARGAAKADCS